MVTNYVKIDLDANKEASMSDKNPRTEKWRAETPPLLNSGQAPYKYPKP